MLFTVLGGLHYYYDSLLEGITELSDRIYSTGREIRKDLGGKLDEQTEAIHENTKGLAVLEERASGIEADIIGLENKIDKNVNRLEEKLIICHP